MRWIAYYQDSETVKDKGYVTADDFVDALELAREKGANCIRRPDVPQPDPHRARIVASLVKYSKAKGDWDKASEEEKDAMAERHNNKYSMVRQRGRAKKKV